MSYPHFDGTDHLQDLRSNELDIVLKALYDIANSAHGAGFWKTSFTPPRVFNHSLGFEARFKCKPHENASFFIDATFYKTGYTLKFSSGLTRKGSTSDITIEQAEEFADNIKAFFLNEMEEACSNSFSKNNNEPVTALIDVKKDPLKLAKHLQQKVREDRDFKIFLFREENAPRKPPSLPVVKVGFWKRWGIRLGLADAPLPPPPPVYSPSADDLPAYVTELPKYLEDNIGKLPTDELKDSAEKVLSNVWNALAVLNYSEAKNDALNAVFKAASTRKLKQDLAIINIGIKEFNFSRPQTELSEYFASVNIVLENHLKPEEENAIGAKVALDKIRSRVSLQVTYE